MTEQRLPSWNTLTVVVRDDSGVVFASTPHADYRTVRLTLTPEQQRALTPKNGYEHVSQTVLEAIHD